MRQCRAFMLSILFQYMLRVLKSAFATLAVCQVTNDPHHYRTIVFNIFRIAFALHLKNIDELKIQELLSLARKTLLERDEHLM